MLFSVPLTGGDEETEARLKTNRVKLQYTQTQVLKATGDKDDVGGGV